MCNLCLFRCMTLLNICWSFASKLQNRNEKWLTLCGEFRIQKSFRMRNGSNCTPKKSRIIRSLREEGGNSLAETARLTKRSTPLVFKHLQPSKTLVDGQVDPKKITVQVDRLLACEGRSVPAVYEAKRGRRMLR